MQIFKRFTVGAAALAAAGGFLAIGAPANAAETAAAPVSVQALNCGAAQIIVGTGGVNVGAKVQCFGGAFTIAIRCERRDNHLQYTHFGNRAVSGGWSTAWCDVNADVIGAKVVPS